LFKRTQVSEIDATIASLVGPLSNLKSKLEQSIEDLDFLKDQMRVTEEDLRRVYILGN
jgi:peptidoglycan hydrolase CwlO-like protein